MDTQQIITLGLIGIAAVYLGRLFVKSVRAFLSNKAGCSSGCGKCGLAAIAEKRATISRKDVIPLSNKSERT